MQVSAGQITVPQSAVGGIGESTQAPAPSHDRDMHVSETQSKRVPVQAPARHASPKVQASPSSQATVVRQAQVPPAFVQR